jgi:hypothetical protein
MQRRHVLRIDRQHIFIRFDRLIVTAELVQRDAEIEKPGGVVGIDGGGGAQFDGRFLPAPLLEKLGSPLGPLFCIAPVVHAWDPCELRASKRT